LEKTEWMIYRGVPSEKKKENEPEIYTRILEVDKETRETRPHFHGMAFARGYAHVPKRDEGLFYQNIVDSLTEDRRQLLFEYMAKVNERNRRGEYIADDDYVTFEGGKYNPFSSEFSLNKKK